MQWHHQSGGCHTTYSFPGCWHCSCPRAPCSYTASHPAVGTSSSAAHEHISPVKISQVAPALLSHSHPCCLTSGARQSTRALEMSVMTLVQCHLYVKHLLSLEQTLGLRTCPSTELHVYQNKINMLPLAPSLPDLQFYA